MWSEFFHSTVSELKTSLLNVQADLHCDNEEMRRLLLFHRRQLFFAASLYSIQVRSYAAKPVYLLALSKLRSDAGLPLSLSERAIVFIALVLFVALSAICISLPGVVLLNFGIYLIAVQVIFPLGLYLRQREGVVWREVLGRIADGFVYTVLFWGAYVLMICAISVKVLMVILPSIWFLCSRRLDKPERVLRHLANISVANSLFKSTIGNDQVERFCAYLATFYVYFDEVLMNYIPVTIDNERRMLFARKMLVLSVKDNFAEVVTWAVERTIGVFFNCVGFAISCPKIFATFVYDYFIIYFISLFVSVGALGLEEVSDNNLQGIFDDCSSSSSDDDDNQDGHDPEEKVKIEELCKTIPVVDIGGDKSDCVKSTDNGVSIGNSVDSENGVLVNGDYLKDELFDRVVGATPFQNTATVDDNALEEATMMSTQSRLADDSRKISTAPKLESKLAKTTVSKREVCVCPIPTNPETTLEDLLVSYNEMSHTKEDFSSYFSLRLEEFTDKISGEEHLETCVIEPLDVYLKLNITLDGLCMNHVDFVARFTPAQYKNVAEYDFLTHLSFKTKRNVTIARPAVCIASDAETCQGSILVYYKLLFFTPFKTEYRTNLKDSLWRTFVMHFSDVSRSGYGRIVRKCKTGTALVDNFGAGTIDLSAIVDRTVGRIDHRVMVSSCHANLVDEFRLMYPNLSFVVNPRVDSDVDHPKCQIINTIQAKVIKSKLSHENTMKVVHFSSRGPGCDDVNYGHLHNFPIIDCYDVDRLKASIGSFSATLNNLGTLFSLRSYAFVAYLLRLDAMHMNRNLLKETSKLKQFLMSIDETKRNLKSPDSYSYGGTGIMFHLNYYFSFSNCVNTLRELGFESLYYTYHEDLLAAICDEWSCVVTEMRCRKEGEKLHFYTSGAGGKSYVCNLETYLSWAAAPDVGKVGDTMYVKEKLSTKGSLVSYKLRLLEGHDVPELHSMRVEYSFMVGNYIDPMTRTKKIKAFKVFAPVFNKFITAVIPKLSSAKTDAENFCVFLAVFRGHQYRTIVIGTGPRAVDPMALTDDDYVVKILFRYVLDLFKSRKCSFFSKLKCVVVENILNESVYSIDNDVVESSVRTLRVKDIIHELSDPRYAHKVFYVKEGSLIDVESAQSDKKFLTRPTRAGLRHYANSVEELVKKTVLEFERKFVIHENNFDGKIYNSACGDIYVLVPTNNFVESTIRLVQHFGGASWYLLNTNKGPMITNRSKEHSVEIVKDDLQVSIDDYSNLTIVNVDGLEWTNLNDFIANHTVSELKIDAINSDPFTAGVVNEDANDMAAAVQYRRVEFIKNKKFIEDTIYTRNGMLGKVLNINTCQNLQGIIVCPRIVSRGSNAIVQELVNDFCLQLAISVHLITAKCLNFDINRNSADEKLYIGVEKVAPYCVDMLKNKLVRTSFVAKSSINLRASKSRLRVMKDMLVFHPLMQLNGVVKRIQDWFTFDPKSVLFVQGVAGCGKTTFIKNLYKRVKCNKLVMTASRESAKELEECKAITATSFLQNYTANNVDLLIVDEAVMLHEGLLILVIAFTGAKRTLILGDQFQLRFVHGTTLKKPLSVSLFDIPINQIDIRHTYRMPQDVTTLLGSVYGKITTSNVVKNSMEAKITSNPVGELRELLVGFDTQKTLVTCFTQSTKLVLESQYQDYKVLTVHEAQGQTFDNVVLVRDTFHSVPLFEPNENGINPWMLVALSRHTKMLKYYTVVSDFLYKSIISVKREDCYAESGDPSILNSIVTAMPTKSDKMELEVFETYFSKFQKIEKKSFENTLEGLNDFKATFAQLEEKSPTISVPNMSEIVDRDLNVFYATSNYELDIKTNQIEPSNTQPFKKRNWLDSRIDYMMELSANVQYANISNIPSPDIRYDIPRMILCSRRTHAFRPTVEGRQYYGQSDCWYIALKSLMEIHYRDFSDACESMDIPRENFIVRFISMLKRFAYDNHYVLHSDLVVRENSLFISTSDIDYAKNFKVAIYLLLKDCHIVITEEHAANYVVAYNNMDINAVLRKHSDEITIEVNQLENAKLGVLNDELLLRESNDNLANKILRKICNVFSGSELNIVNPWATYSPDWDLYGTYKVEVSPVNYDVINDVYRATFYHTYRGSDLYPRYVQDSWFEKEILAENVRFNEAELMNPINGI